MGKLKDFFKPLKHQAKKGATYTTKEGEVREYSDFKRGEAVGRMKQKYDDTKYAINFQKEKNNKN